MRLQFGDCVFDLDTREVFRGGKPIHVSPKAFALLTALIERRPKAISKEELSKLLWPDTFVTDANLPNLVAELREPFGDDAHRIIRTVPRFGYAFQAKAPEDDPARAAMSYRLIWGDREIALRPGENVIGRDETPPSGSTTISSRAGTRGSSSTRRGRCSRISAARTAPAFEARESDLRRGSPTATSSRSAPLR